MKALVFAVTAAIASLSVSAFANVITLASGDVITLTTSNGPTTVQCQAPSGSGAPALEVYCTCEKSDKFLFLWLNNVSLQPAVVLDVYDTTTTGAATSCMSDAFSRSGRFYNHCRGQ